MTSGACTTALPAQTDLVIGAAPAYSISASEVNSSGYSYVLCYSCDIQPTGLPLIKFNKDPVTITMPAPPPDCTIALADAGFLNPAPIPYSAGGATITVVTAYTDIFVHSFPVDCPIGTCRWYTSGAC